MAPLPFKDPPYVVSSFGLHFLMIPTAPFLNTLISN